MARSILLSRDHNEAGKQYYAGQTVVVSDESYDFIISAGLTARAESVIVAEPTAEPTAEPITFINTNQGD